KHTTDPVSRIVERCSVSEIDLDAAHDRSHGPHTEILQSCPQVAHQQVNEPGSIASLEGELLVMDDDGVHSVSLCLGGQGSLRSVMPAPHRTLDRSGQPGFNPVAGEIQPAD